MIRRLALPSLSALFLACASATSATSESRLALTPVPQAPPDPDFRATGEVLSRGSSVAFNDWLVVGPKVNLTRRGDGTWAGDLGGTDVLLTPSDGRLSGASADLHFLSRDGQLLVRGRVGGRDINVRLQPGDGIPTSSGIACRYEGNFVNCDAKAAAERPGIELRGLAARTRDPVMPQLGLALVALRGPSL
jgi:hypothetical protein